MLSKVESILARVGLCLFLFGLAIGAGDLILDISVPFIWTIATLATSSIFLISSFGMFRIQTLSPELKTNVGWTILLSPIVLYIPLNLILILLGLVQQPKLQDFGAYYNGAVRFLNNAPLYQTTQDTAFLQAQISGDMPYLYPPIFILLFAPFTIFPVVVAGMVWNVSVLLLLLYSVSKLVDAFEMTLTRSHKFLLYLSVISFGPTITWVKAGQISGLLAALLCLSGAALRSQKNTSSGILTTVASAFKPFYATSGAHLLRSRRRLLASLVTGLCVLLFGLLIFGLETHLEYLNILLEGKGWETTKSPDRWNAGHFNPFFILGPLKHLPRIALIFATVGFTLYSNRLKIPIEYIFALGVAIIPLAGPTTNTLALSAAIPATAIVGLYELENNRKFPKLLVVSTLLIHIHPYTVEFLSKFGPQIYPNIELATPIIPLIQPALYGMILLTGYIVFQSLKSVPSVP